MRGSAILTKGAVVTLGAEEAVHYYHGWFGFIRVCVGRVMAGVC